jgi:hypothetical protein
MDEHRCGTGRLCRDPIVNTVTGRREPAVIETPNGLCQRCLAALRRAVEELPTDYERLCKASAPVATSGNAEHVSGTPEPRVPLNMAAIELRSTLSEWAELAVVLVAPALGIAVRRRQKARGHPVTEGPAITQAASILPDNLDRLIEADSQELKLWKDGRLVTGQASGMDVAVRLMRNHWKAVALVGDSNPRKRLAMPCPVIDCGAPTLGIANGETDVTCTSCGNRWSESEYNWLAGLLVDQDRKRRDKSTKFLQDLGRWLVAERDWKLRECRRIASLTKDQLDGIDGWAVVQLLREVMDCDKVATVDA